MNKSKPRYLSKELMEEIALEYLDTIIPLAVLHIFGTPTTGKMALDFIKKGILEDFVTYFPSRFDVNQLNERAITAPTLDAVIKSIVRKIENKKNESVSPEKEMTISMMKAFFTQLKEEMLQSMETKHKEMSHYFTREMV